MRWKNRDKISYIYFVIVLYEIISFANFPSRACTRISLRGYFLYLRCLILSLPLEIKREHRFWPLLRLFTGSFSIIDCQRGSIGYLGSDIPVYWVEIMILLLHISSHASLDEVFTERNFGFICSFCRVQ